MDQPEVVWDGRGYLCVSDPPPIPAYPPLLFPLRMGTPHAAILDAFLQYGPLSIRQLHGYVPDESIQALQRYVTVLRRRGQLCIHQKQWSGRNETRVTVYAKV